MGRENCTTGLSPVGKPYNRPGGRGNAPLLVAGATTSRRGDFILRYALSGLSQH